MEHAFLRINLWRNKTNRHKIVARYLSSILKFKIKLNETNCLQKLKNNSIKSKNIKALSVALANWFNNKLKYQKTIAFLILTYKFKTPA